MTEDEKNTKTQTNRDKNERKKGFGVCKKSYSIDSTPKDN